MENKTILIVDDTIANLDILGELLDGYDVIDATNGSDALEIVQEEKIDLILLDIMMPHMDGFEVCQRLKKDPYTEDIPIIFITAMSDEDSIEKAYDIGGSDYVTKPFKPKELIARVKRELKLVALQEELKLLASIDPMTKLYNRRYFSKASENMLDLAKREKKELALIMVDIDRFKNINDTYGHDTGDDVIIAFADMLHQMQRESDIICRFGGEEFVILMPETDSDGASVVAHKIKEKTHNIAIEIQNKSLSFTVSSGVSSIKVHDEKTIQAALKRADEALYEAKQNGRDRVCVH
ncbi:MAG: diguanylate cyclase [Campylobacterota bacterium]|nr:diguanylate cyclase [Campylobacterota bacterium]